VVGRASSFEPYRALRARQNVALSQRRALLDELRSEIARALKAIDDASSGQLTARAPQPRPRSPTACGAPSSRTDAPPASS
jgi:hypothetical protein